MNLNIDWNRYKQDIVDKLLLGVQYVHGMDVLGDIAEFGTMTGETAEALAIAIQMSDINFGDTVRAAGHPPKRLHLFDSFVGLPASAAEPDINAPHVRSGVWSAGTCRGLTAQQLRDLCSQKISSEKIMIYDGWFSETTKQIKDGTSFSLVHIDCDLYISTMDALVPLLERRLISPGGMIFFDDWNCNRASPSFGERKAWAECVERFDIRFSDGGEYGLASHKFIVHDYK